MRLYRLVDRSTSRRILFATSILDGALVFDRRPKVRSVAGGMASIAKTGLISTALLGLMSFAVLLLPAGARGVSTGAAPRAVSRAPPRPFSSRDQPPNCLTHVRRRLITGAGRGYWGEPAGSPCLSIRASVRQADPAMDFASCRFLGTSWPWQSFVLTALAELARILRERCRTNGARDKSLRVIHLWKPLPAPIRSWAFGGKATKDVVVPSSFFPRLCFAALSRLRQNLPPALQRFKGRVPSRSDLGEMNARERHDASHRHLSDRLPV